MTQTFKIFQSSPHKIFFFHMNRDCMPWPVFGEAIRFPFWSIYQGNELDCNVQRSIFPTKNVFRKKNWIFGAEGIFHVWNNHGTKQPMFLVYNHFILHIQCTRCTWFLKLTTIAVPMFSEWHVMNKKFVWKKNIESLQRIKLRPFDMHANVTCLSNFRLIIRRMERKKHITHWFLVQKPFNNWLTMFSHCFIVICWWFFTSLNCVSTFFSF